MRNVGEGPLSLFFRAPGDDTIYEMCPPDQELPFVGVQQMTKTGWWVPFSHDDEIYLLLFHIFSVEKVVPTVGIGVHFE